MAKEIKDPGVGKSSNKHAKRFVNPDGSFNIKHVNRVTSLSESYKYLVTIGWGKFFLWVLLGYTLVNVVFALVYTFLGVSNITEPTGSFFEDFANAFFFSAQTITTVGYGAMAPKGIAYGIVSSIEALVGLLSFSFVTGLLYGRFSRPRSSIRFSENMVLRKHNDGDSIMFRLMSRSANVMISPKIEATLTLSHKDEDEKFVNNFYKLELERNSITYLPTTWTIVHPINKQSPLCKYERDKLTELKGEVLILVSYYDESFKQEVHQTHSYTFLELKKDHRFVPAFYYDKNGYVVLDHDNLDKTVKTEIL